MMVILTEIEAKVRIPKPNQEVKSKVKLLSLRKWIALSYIDYECR